MYIVMVLKLKLAVSALSIQEAPNDASLMKAMFVKDSDASAGYKRPSLPQLENMLQELTRVEDRKRRLSVETVSVATKEKLLNDQLRQSKAAQEELVAAQTSKAQLCEEVGRLKQTNEHQATQLNKFMIDLQTARESQSAVKRKMEELEASTSTIKQQYIRSLASRIQTSSFVLQQLNVVKPQENSFSSASGECENAKSKKSKRIMEEIGEQQDFGDGRKPKPTGPPAEIEPQSLAVVDPEDPVMGKLNHDNGAFKQHEKGRAEKEKLAADLRAQMAALESKYSALSDKYKVLESKHYVLAVTKTSGQEIKAKEAQIEELMQKLDVSRSKQRNTIANESATNGDESANLDGRLKMLEENLAQMNGYADQLEIVIAQCPSCTTKMQNESTQDSTTNRVE
ncbi:hypothetical protein P3T76_010803 [Phytophthora citrophthora]|uniref:Uncharacterized protein n=1 Tax=Phytophthora citrophthora TaxID=4793 RepID=A0AAD9GB14_9STRA|nr:hypothetical protein P3T76_010803 [Phytophthora citrophthora]